MAYLQTLEGESDILERLFDTNDALGCIIYGPKNWNRIKNFVANLATSEIIRARKALPSLIKVAGFCRQNNDILDRLYNIDYDYGCELLGSDRCNALVNGVKAAPAMLGLSFDLSSFYNPTKIAKQAQSVLMPTDWSASGLAKFFTGYQPSKYAYEQIKEVTGQTAQEEAEKAAKEAKRKAEEKANLDAYTGRMDALERERIAANAEYEKAKAEAEAAASAKTAMYTNPSFLKSQTTNILLIGGLGIGAIYLLTRRK